MKVIIKMYTTKYGYPAVIINKLEKKINKNDL